MLDQSQVDDWLEEFVSRLKDAFGERLRWVGHHGSWARGEPTEASDIDCMVLLDRLGDADLRTFKDIVYSMPDAATLASGSIMSIRELQLTPRIYMIQCFYGNKVLHGSLQGIVEPPDDCDLIDDIKYKADDNLHTARHCLLYPHDLPKAVLNLKYQFKRCYFALQSWFLLTRDVFICTKEEMLDIADDPDDAEVTHVARDWGKLTDDLTARPEYYIELLERWSRGMHRKLDSWEESR